MTIGADGVHSTVAGSVGATVERQAAHASSVIYAFMSGLQTGGYEWFYAPGVTAALIPTNDGQTCVSVGVPPGRVGAELAGDLPASFRRLLAEASPELAARVAGAAPAGRLGSFAGLPGFMRRPWGPGWALVGDAGYYLDPIVAHGTSEQIAARLNEHLEAGADHVAIQVLGGPDGKLVGALEELAGALGLVPPS